jgi:lysophospholipase L1-like esterase
MPVISWGVPAYSQNGSAGSNANSATHATLWRSSGYPTYLAYDLSSVPSTSRQQVYVQWWNTSSYGYNQSTTYNLPGSYVLEGNAAAGGSLPSSGWVQLNDNLGKAISVTGNTVSNRAHVAMLNGMNWIRFRATAGASGNASQNTDCQIAMDVSDAHLGLDGWHFVGDSITGLWAPQSTTDFTEVIKSSTSGTYAPSFDADGIPGIATSNYPISTYLPLWPGKYVGIQLGANDSGSNPSAYYSNMLKIIDALLAAGKTVMVATPSWQSVAMGHQDMSQLAAQVPLIVSHYQALGKPVYAGPDMYAYFSQSANQKYITSNDGLHPNSAGAVQMASLWAQAAVQTFY